MFPSVYLKNTFIGMQGQIRNHSQVEGEKLGSSHSKIVSTIYEYMKECLFSLKVTNR